MSEGAERRPPWADAHDRADAAGDDGYLDPVSGLFVFTAGYLRRRGRCCGSGCRHCPYGTTGAGPQDRPPAGLPARRAD